MRFILFSAALVLAAQNASVIDLAPAETNNLKELIAKRDMAYNAYLASDELVRATQAAIWKKYKIPTPMTTYADTYTCSAPIGNSTTTNSRWAEFDKDYKHIITR